jgi:thiamine-phosphate pyrophosphorylase
LDQLSLCLVTDRRQTRGRDLVDVVAACLAVGLPAVQLREKDLGAGDLVEIARALRRLTAAHRALLVINDRADVALAVGADAIQRTGASMPIRDVRAVVGPRVKIGASTHALDEALAAEEAGADWVVLGPVFETPSKAAYGPALGLHALEKAVATVRLPVVAIGGITPERARQVRATGARGVAVISAILAADSPADATRRFLESLA